MPRLTGAELVSALERGGFEIIRIRGSHRFLRHTDGRTTVVPVHAGEAVGPGLMGKIPRDAEFTRDDLLALL